MLEADRAGFARGGTWILRNLSVQFRAGTVAAVVGPNGSGKSTALRLLAGLLRASEGRVSINGRPAHMIKRGELARTVTYVPQSPPAVPTVTVRECVAMGRYCHRGRFRAEGEADRKAVGEALETMDCARFANRLMGDLSGGEVQRAILARSLATAAPYLLLDEPTASLDIEHSLSILDHVAAAAEAGRCVVMALHDLNSVIRSADFVCVLKRGTVRHAGPPLQALYPQVVRDVFSVESELVQGRTGAAFRFDPVGHADP